MNDADRTPGGEELDEETKRRAQERAEEIDRMYEPGARPTVTVPGTDGMVSGTAFADVADDGGTDDERPASDTGRADRSGEHPTD